MRHLFQTEHLYFRLRLLLPYFDLCCCLMWNSYHRNVLKLYRLNKLQRTMNMKKQRTLLQYQSLLLALFKVTMLFEATAAKPISEGLKTHNKESFKIMQSWHLDMFLTLTHATIVPPAKVTTKSCFARTHQYLTQVVLCILTWLYELISFDRIVFQTDNIINPYGHIMWNKFKIFVVIAR